MKKLITLFTFQLLFLGAFAQIDTEFWFAAPDIDASHGDQPIILRLVAINQSTTVRISQPQNPSFIPIQINAPLNVVQSFDFTPRKNLLENTPANSVLNKGLLIESDDEITVYYEIANGNNAEIFPLKGRNALGKNFRIPAQNEYSNNSGAAEIDIVATEDNTVITIVPTSSVVGHAANVPFTITLNRGETYAARATDVSASGTLAGTKITANKKIAVTTMDDSLFSSGSWDLIGDQIVPVGALGTQYVAVKGNSTVEKVYIIATENNTNLFFDGQTAAATTINDGDLFMQPIINNSLLIESDKPVYVMHLSGVLNEFGDAILPPIGCTGSSKVGFIRTSPQPFDLIVVTESGNEGSFVLNGNPNLLVASDFQPVPGTGGNLVFTKKNFPPTAIGLNASILTNSAGLFHLGLLASTGTGANYGYFSNYRLDIGLSDITVCAGEPAVLSVGGNVTNALWSTGSTSLATVVTESGEYWVNATINGCQVSDTVTVTINEVTANAGTDRTICVDESVEIGTAGNGTATYSWSPSTTLNNGSIPMPTASPTQTTTYTLTVNENNCSATSTVTVNISPTFSVSSQQDETLDYGQTLPITIDVIPNTGTTLPSNLTYIWSPIAGVSNPSSNDVVLSPTETTIYTFTATDADGCEVSISFTVTADNAVSYGIPNAFTPNGKNTHFKPIIEGPIIIKEFLIFNRWGQVMYNEPDGTGWDGNANGMEQPQDTYIYIGQLEMPDGEVIRVKGELLLVR